VLAHPGFIAHPPGACGAPPIPLEDPTVHPEHDVEKHPAPAQPDLHQIVVILAGSEPGVPYPCARTILHLSVAS
jgi:hypothetical protein